MIYEHNNVEYFSFCYGSVKAKALNHKLIFIYLVHGKREKASEETGAAGANKQYDSYMY